MTSNIWVGKDGLEKQIYLTSEKNRILGTSECEKEPTFLRKTYIYII